MTTQTQYALAQAIGQIDRVGTELGWLTSVTRRAVEYRNQRTGAVREQQARLDRATGGLCLVYVFAAFEQAIDLFRSLPELLQEVDRVTGSAELRERILAYRHLRHVAAHGFEGERSSIRTHASEFERVHDSGQLPNIRWDRAADRVEIDPSAWMEARDLLREAASKILNSPEARKV